MSKTVQYNFMCTVFILIHVNTEKAKSQCWKMYGQKQIPYFVLWYAVKVVSDKFISASEREITVYYLFILVTGLKYKVCYPSRVSSRFCLAPKTTKDTQRVKIPLCMQQLVLYTVSVVIYIVPVTAHMSSSWCKDTTEALVSARKHVSATT